MAVTLTVEGLVKRFRRFVLNVDKLVLSEDIHVLIGPNGSGKTVLLKTLAGLLRPDKGSIIYEIDGEEIRSLDVLPFVSLVTTDLELPNYTISKLLRLYGVDDASVVKDIALEFRIEKFLDKRYGELSSGYKKRVQLAIALSMPSKIIYLDEPFINVDSEYMGFLEEKILDLRDKLVIVASHIPSILFRHNIIAIEDGRILYHGRIPNVVESMVEVTIGNKTLSLGELLEKCQGRETFMARVRSIQEAVFQAIRKRMKL